MRGFLQATPRFLGSFGLCVTLLGLLLLLTFFGTLEQRFASIYDVQKKYFESLLLTNVRWSESSTIPVLLPGAYLVLSALAVNLIVGGLIRIRKGTATLGVIITHVGMLVLLAAGVVEHHFSTKGTMALAEADLGPSFRRVSDEFQAWFEWDLVVAEHQPDGSVVERLIPWEDLEDLGPEEGRTFADPALPFDVRVSGWCRNAIVVAARGAGSVEGAALERRTPDRAQAERNTPGLVATLRSKAGASGVAPRAVLHARQRFPWRVRHGGPAGPVTYDLDLRLRRWDVPFALELESAVGRYHPGTDRPKEFTSRVVKLEEGTREPVVITMNQPLRHRGYTFFQSGFEAGGVEDGVDVPTRTVLAVVRNPADAWPEIACWIMAAGLLLHLGRKLWLYATAEALKRRAA
jgi:hypothetical protein